VLALGGTQDHVHLLASLAPTVSISELMKQAKGVSSRFANSVLGYGGTFKWQGSYAAFSVSRWDLDRAAEYVRR